MATYPTHTARYRGGNQRCDYCFGPLDRDLTCRDLDCRQGKEHAQEHMVAEKAEVVTRHGLPPMEEQNDLPEAPLLGKPFAMTNIRQLTNQQAELVDAALARVRAELLHAMVMHGPMHSGHEAYGVIKEELDEFFDEVRANRHVNFRKELVQVAAMAVRAMVDLT